MDRPRQVNLPKALKYDGTTNWEAFFVKFSKYADRSQWTTQDRKDQLCWCLDGKASEFYTTLISRDDNMDYFDLVRKLEKRFNFQDLPETLQVQFMGARQNPGEKLEDWADRLLSLATKAFRHLPEDHASTQAILRFCQGCSDKEAGQHAATQRPTSMEDAIDKIKWYQHTVKAIYGHPVRKRENLSEYEDDTTKTVSVAKPERQSHQESEAIKSMESTIKMLVDQMQTVQTSLNKIQAEKQPSGQKDSNNTQKNYNQNNRRQNAQRGRGYYNRFPNGQQQGGRQGKFPNRQQQGGRFPTNMNFNCFYCNQPGHMMRDCSLLPKMSSSSSSTQNDNPTPLNEGGSD